MGPIRVVFGNSKKIQKVSKNSKLFKEVVRYGYVSANQKLFENYYFYKTSGTLIAQSN